MKNFSIKVCIYDFKCYICTVDFVNCCYLNENFGIHTATPATTSTRMNGGRMPEFFHEKV